MDVDFYKGQYETEWQRRDQIQSASSLPVALLTLLGSSEIVMADRFSPIDNYSAAIFWLAFTTAALACVAGIYLLAKSYYGFQYRRIPLPSHLLEYEVKLRQYYAQVGGASEADIQKEISQHLVDAFVDAGDRNGVNNVNRGEYLHHANTAIVIALAFVAVAAVPCAISIKERPESTQRVHITNIPKAMSDKNNQPSQPSTPSTQTKPVDPVPSKPTFPQNIDIRTGTQEPRKKV